jgi:hypothetical protein
MSRRRANADECPVFIKLLLRLMPITRVGDEISGSLGYDRLTSRARKAVFGVSSIMTLRIGDRRTLLSIPCACRPRQCTQIGEHLLTLQCYPWTHVSDEKEREGGDKLVIKVFVLHVVA